jgi:hypothetical protein
MGAEGDAAPTLLRSWFANPFHMVTIKVMATAASMVGISFRSRAFCFSGMVFSSRQHESSEVVQ